VTAARKKGEALLHALVLSASPGGLARLLVVTAVLAGAAAERQPTQRPGLLFRPRPVGRRRTD